MINSLTIHVAVLSTVNPVFREGPDGRLTPINVYMGGMRIVDIDEKQ